MPPKIIRAASCIIKNPYTKTRNGYETLPRLGQAKSISVPTNLKSKIKQYVKKAALMKSGLKNAPKVPIVTKLNSQIILNKDIMYQSQ